MRVLLGMSGGLDSTYAARKLIDAGHEVEGIVLRMHEYTEVDQALEAASTVGIKCHVMDCSTAFSNTVVNNFIREYRDGRTPNPCVLCNSEVKFKCLYDFALKNGFDKIATGHYAKIEKKVTRDGTKPVILTARDEKKDQSYMLWQIADEILDMLILPLGDDMKDDVREAARDAGLSVSDRKESQDICFIPDGDHAAFIEARTGRSKQGRFVDTDGNTLGTHDGLIRYTVGQRKGLGISAPTRLVIIDINPYENEITLAPTGTVTTETVYLSNARFIGMDEPDVGSSFDVGVRLRYHAPIKKCRLVYHGHGRATAELCDRIPPVTPGQSAVFYDGNTVVAGAVIEYLPF